MRNSQSESFQRVVFRLVLVDLVRVRAGAAGGSRRRDFIWTTVSLAACAPSTNPCTIALFTGPASNAPRRPPAATQETRAAYAVGDPNSFAARYGNPTPTGPAMQKLITAAVSISEDN